MMRSALTRTARTAARVVALVALLPAASCATERLVAVADALRLTVDISAPVVDSGEVVTLSARLRNVSNTPVTLGFGSSCQMLHYIDDASGKPVVGWWGCATVITSLSLQPGEEVTQPLAVRGGTERSDSPLLTLPPGTYRAYAELGERVAGRPARLRCNTITFEVRP
jgi:hypothetical protein